MEQIMIVILGLIILIAAVVVGVAGVLTNGGSTHALTHGFAVLGYHVTGSTGTLFLCGIVVGAVALFGLTLLLAGARRTSRRGRARRRELKQSRRETAAASQARDALIDQRDNARAATAGSATAAQSPAAQQSGAQSPAAAPVNGTAAPAIGSTRRTGPLGRPRMFLRPPGSRHAADTEPEWPATQPAADAVDEAPAPNVPAGASAPAE